MSAANTSARDQLKQIHTRRLLQNAIRSTIENLETRRLFAAPTADPGGAYNVAEGSSVLVSGLGSSDDGQIVTYQWDTNYSAGRGFRARFTGTKFNFTASDSGTRTIALRVTDNDGEQHTATTTINIADVAPTLSLSAPNNAAEGQSFNITWSHTDPGQSDTVTAWTVDWGDGQTSTYGGDATGASHAYAEDGNYVIELTSTQTDATTSVTHNITIDNEAPQVTASTSTPAVDEGDTVSVTFSSPNRSATIEGWVIDWNDGNIDVLPASATSYTHQYTDSGLFTATISALEPDGGTGSATVNFTVANIDPGVTITGVPASEDEGTAITVGSTVSDVGADDTHTYGWTVYRDGQHFVLPGGTDITNTGFTFTPTDNGSYVIRLTVLDDDGGSTTVNSSAIVVNNVDPTANITGAPVGSIDEGTTVNLTATPSDAGDEDTFSYAWTVTKDGQAYTLPNGTTTDAASFSFVPRDNGSYIATVVVTDDDGGTVTVATAAITVDNAAPVAGMTGTPVGQPDEGDTVNASATVSDPGEDDTHTYAWSVTKDGNPYDLTGVTTDEATFAFVPNDNADYVISLTITDDDGATDTVTSATITVNNLPPIPEIAGDTTANEGDTVSLTSDLLDRGSADTHTYAWSVEKDGNPFVLPGGTVTNGTSFAFEPTDNGSYVVSLQVTDDDGGTATVTHTITVSNVAPTVQQDNVPATGDEGTAITVDSTVTDAGADDTLTYGWTVYRDGQSFALPGGTTLDGQSFTFIPTDNGSYVVRLTVLDDDGGSTTVNSSPIIVANVDPTGAISGEPVGNIDEGTAVNLTVTPADAGDEDTFSYAWTVTKGGQSYDLTGVTTDEANFSFTPNDNGTYVATVVVTDDDGGTVSVASQAITVDNVDPVAGITGAPVGNVDEGDTISLGSSVTDAGTADTHTYAWTVTKDGNPFDLTGITTNASTFSFVPTDNGDYVATLVVTDDDGGTDTVSTATITVDNVAPTGVLTGDDTTDEGSTVNYSVAVTDPGSADTHTYLWSVEKDGNPYDLTGITVNQSTFAFAPNDNGAYVVSVVVTDDDAGTNTYTHNLTVANVAPTPAITGAPANSDEGTAINLGSTVTDPGSTDTQSYAWSVTKNGVATADTGTNSTFSFTPDDNAEYVVTLVTTDSDGATGTTTATITVDNVAPTAVISGEPVGNINEGDQVDLTATPSDAGSADTFSYAWTITQDAQSYLPGVTTTNSTLSFIPRDNGTYVATVVVTDDDGATVSVDSVNIVVDNVDPVGSITGMPVGNVNEGTEIAVGSTTLDVGADDTHTYSWSVTKDGNPFDLTGVTTDASNFAFTPTDNGDYVITLVVTDDDGGTDTVTSATITVDNVAPTGVLTGDSAADEGSTVNYAVAVTDPGSADTHTYLWSVTKDGNPFDLTGITVNASTFAFVPTDNGAYVISVDVTDDDGGSNTYTHNLTVSNVAPTVQQDNVPATGDEGTAITVDSTVTDAGDDDTLTYGWTVYRDGQSFALPGGTTLDGQSFTFTPTDNGSYVVRLTVLDDDGGSTTVNSSPIIVANVDPTGAISGEPVGNIDEGTAVNLTVTPADAGDEDTFSYAWTVTKGGQSYDLTGVTTDEANFSFTPNDNGTYVATVVVTDDDGGTVSVASQAITVDNVDPVAGITGSPVGNVDEGDTISLGSSVTDAGSADTHTYAWTVTKDGNPFDLTGITTNASTFSFVPTDNGDYVATLVVTDDDGGTDTVSTATITADNVTPVATISGNASVDEASSITLSTAVSDAGADDTHTYLWSVTKDGNPYDLTGITVDGASFTFTPSSHGAYVVSVDVTDDDGATTTATHNLTVNNLPPAVTINGLPSGVRAEGYVFNVTASAVDPGGDNSFTYLWSVTKNGSPWTLPGGTVTNASSFTFEATDNGTYRITAAVTDSGGATGTSTTSNLLITNALPNGVMNNVPQTPVDENTSITVDVTADDPGSEDTLTYAWSVTKNGQAFALPGGTVTNATSFTFTPTDNGTYIASVAVTDDDGGVTSIASGAITVQNVAPTASISGEPAQAELEGVLLQLLGDAEDVSPLDTFTYAWTVTKDGNPYDLTGVTTNTAALNFNPTDNGTYVATLTVTDDDGGSVTVSSQAIVIDNVAPTGVLTGDSTADEGSTVNYSVAVTDPGSADTQTYLWSVTKDGNPFDLTGVTVNASTFAFVPDDNAAYVVSVVVTDDDGGTNTYTHNLTVANVAPTVQQDNVPATGDEGSSITVDSTVTDAGSADTLTYGWTVFKDGQSFTLPGGTTTDGQSFTFIPTDNGSYVVRLTVLDDDGGSTTVNSSPIIVANVNPAGVISGEPGAPVDEGSTVSLSVVASDAGANDTFTYSWSVTKNGQAYSLAGVTTNQANLEFTTNDNGTYVATVVITDNNGGSVSVASQSITVANVNPLANFDPIPTTGVEGTAISVASTSTDAGTADTFTYTWSVTKNGQPYDLTGVTTNASTFSFTPTDNGTYKIILNVVDDDGASDTFNGPDITVTNVAPTATVSGPATADEGDSITVTSSIADVGSADTHTYAWTVTKDGNPFDLTGVTTDESSLTFTADDQGTYVATLVVTDDDGASVSADHTVEVANVAPAVTMTGAPTTGDEGTEITAGSTVADVDADTLTYGWTIRHNGTPVYPDGVVLNQSTIAFTPSDDGTYTLRLTVMDEDGGSTTVNSSSIVVANVAPSAAITGAPANMDEGTTATLGSTVTDAGADDETAGFTYLWTAWFGDSVAATSEEATFDFQPSVHGTYNITLTVNDKDNGQTTTDATTITVDNVAPSDLEIGGIPETMNEGESTTLTASVTDAPGDTHTYAWTILRNGQAFATGEGAELLFDPNRRGSYDIEVVATDSAGATTSATTTIEVENLAPVASVSASNAPLLLGEAASYLLTLSDVPPQQAFTVTWNFGDGSSPVVETYTGDQTNVAKSYTYAAAGTYTTTVSVSDGIATTTTTTSITVSRAAVRTSPFDSTKTALFVLGTTSADSITVEPASTPGNYKVTMNGVVLGDTFNPTGRVIVSGGSGGADGIVVTGGISAVVKDLGGASYVQTDSGNDIVIGSNAADYVTTGAGRDILIGNGGGDTLRGGTSEDVLVANVINWGASNTSIKTALDTWAGADAFAARVTAMKATNLFGTAAISNDSVQDQLYGESQSDWFVNDSASDRIRDWQSAYDQAN